jgi:hypothetical protein
MIFQVEDIVRDVRVSLDMNRSDEALMAEGDEDIVKFDEIIRSKIVEAVERVHTEAPYYLLDNAHHFEDDSSITWKDQESGEILLPDDFMRLVVFEMSDWERSVYVLLNPSDPDYSKLRSRVKAVRGTAQRPVCALGMRNDGKVLEFYSCNSEEATVSKAVYLPWPSIDATGGIDISEKCYRAVVYTVAGLTLTTCGEAERGTAYLDMAKTQLQK